MTNASGPMECAVRVFTRRILPCPTITPTLRHKVVGAYHYLAGIYSFATPDIRLGNRLEIPGLALSQTDYAEHERTFNSVLLGTLLNALLNGSMLYFGPPGSGKTTTPEIVGQVLFGLSLPQIEAATIYAHPNLTEEKMIPALFIHEGISHTLL
ncbi:MAG: hypothetical protein QME05_06715, partial [Candidatus Margulisbacteria bacterium]|nr:hypothetical protein [Candidatus Margulisiibacteriota bacterium]